ncbi:hypothetical protein R70241_02869 [Paraburkholderia saeva]|nr:hypothetical protein R70241_02869 [Paraburkholderia saeva]
MARGRAPAPRSRTAASAVIPAGIPRLFSPPRHPHARLLFFSRSYVLFPRGPHPKPSKQNEPVQFNGSPVQPFPFGPLHQQQALGQRAACQAPLPADASLPRLPRQLKSAWQVHAPGLCSRVPPARTRVDWRTLIGEHTDGPCWQMQFTNWRSFASNLGKALSTGNTGDSWLRRSFVLRGPLAL